MTLHRWAVGLHVVLSLVFAAGGVGMILPSWNDPVAGGFYWRPAALIVTGVWLTFALVGALIWLRQPANAVGWILSAIGTIMLADAVIGEYALRGLVLEPGSLPVPDHVVVLSLFLWLIPIGLLPILMLVYPTGRFVSGWWKLGAVPTVLGILTGAVATVLIWPYRDEGRELLLADGPPADLPVLDGLMGGTFVLFWLGLLGGVAALVVRWRTGEPVVRRQIGVLMFASAVLTTVLVIYNLVFGAPTNLVSEVVISLAIVGLPLAIAVAVLRYRLYEIGRIISRTVTYSLVVGLLGLVILALVTGMAMFVPSDDPLVVAVSTLTVFASFNPLRLRVQTWVERRFNRSRYDAARVVDRFTGGLQNRIDPEQVVDDWVDVVESTMQPAMVGVWLRSSSRKQVGKLSG